MIRRSIALLLTMLLGAVLVACGDGEGGSGDEAGGVTLDSVEITGDPGSDPKVEWGGELTADEIETTVVTEGDGEQIEDGDSVLAHIWIGNGTTQKKAYSTYETDQPQLLTVSKETLSPLFLEGIEGQPVGSRVAIAASAQTAFGEAGNTAINIGNKDTVLTVVDLISGVEDGPDGKDEKPAAFVPGLEGAQDAPTGFDFGGTPEPTDKLQTSTLIEGEGEPVTKGQTIAVNYLGQVYGGKQPFDESYTKQPTSFPIGIGQVVKGWDQGLVGQTVGSRVVLAIPPELGYGKAGKPDAGIKGTDTLYFVVDILGAA